MDSDESVFDRCSQLLSRNHYAVIDEFLTTCEVSNILRGLESKYSQDKFKKAGIGQNSECKNDSQVRGDFIHWVDSQKTFELKQRFIPYLNDFIDHLNQKCFLSIKDYEMHYSVYPKGTYYKRHLDQFKKDDNRVLSFICYLNFDWKESDGGGLRIYTNQENKDDQCVDIVPKAGRLVCFKSDVLEHEVLVTNKERYSLTGWLLTRSMGL
jgi:SM-20-related protein